MARTEARVDELAGVEVRLSTVLWRDAGGAEGEPFYHKRVRGEG